MPASRLDRGHGPLLPMFTATFRMVTRKNRMTVQSTPPPKTLRLVIHGRVQGVFFRDSMRREAQRLAISGWVRNRTDGAVEAVIQGGSADVDAMLRWAQRGPELARVERVEITPDDGSYTNFEIIRP